MSSQGLFLDAGLCSPDNPSQVSLRGVIQHFRNWDHHSDRPDCVRNSRESSRQVRFDMPRVNSIFNLITAAVIAGASVFAPAGLSDEVPSLGTMIDHSHKPIEVRSKPVIERLPVKVVDPVDLVLNNRGQIFIADRKAECIFRLDVNGVVSLMAEELSGLERIQVDADDSVYALTSSAGESALHQVTSSGRRIVLQTFEFPATSFVRDDVGNFVLAVNRSGRIVRLSSEGVVTDLAELTEPAIDLIYNAGGQLEALLHSAHVVRIPEEGQVVHSAFVEIGSTRLAALDDGSMLSLAASKDGRSRVLHVSREVDRPVTFEVLATVPAGTRAVGFDSLGNLCLANADLRAVTKVTSHFEIPCPHCGKPTRMKFSSDVPAGADTRSF